MIDRERVPEMRNPSRLARVLLATADDMRLVGILDATAHEKIVRSHSVGPPGAACDDEIRT